MAHNSLPPTPDYDPRTEQESGATDGATYGGSLLRLQYEEMERSADTRPMRIFGSIAVGVGFGAVALLVTMVLVAVGTAL